MGDEYLSRQEADDVEVVDQAEDEVDGPHEGMGLRIVKDL